MFIKGEPTGFAERLLRARSISSLDTNRRGSPNDWCFVHEESARWARTDGFVERLVLRARRINSLGTSGWSSLNCTSCTLKIDHISCVREASFIFRDMRRGDPNPSCTMHACTSSTARAAFWRLKSGSGPPRQSSEARVRCWIASAPLSRTGTGTCTGTDSNPRTTWIQCGHCRAGHKGSG